LDPFDVSVAAVALVVGHQHAGVVRVGLEALLGDPQVREHLLRHFGHRSFSAFQGEEHLYISKI